MSYITICHQLVDQQQFAVLKSNVSRYLEETADVQALPLLALAHAHLGERMEAEGVCAELANCMDELAADARVDLAAVYCLFYRIDQAVALLEVVLRQVPEHSLGLARLAWCRMQIGALELARGLYQHAARLAPHRLPVWSALARLCLQAGDITDAQQALDEAIAQLNLVHRELPEAAIELFSAQFRALQLEIWIAADDLAQAEQWLAQRRESLTEDKWIALVTGYAMQLASDARHAEAEEALRSALKYYAENLSLISNLAELAQMQGRTMQLVHLLQRAIRFAKLQDKPEVAYWVRLSGAWLHQQEAQARRAADKAVALAEALEENENTPQAMICRLRLQAKNALAQVESQQQHFKQAETLFQQLLDENPYFLPALQGLGQQQMLLGNIDQAVALFERIKEIDPAKGYSSLINARKFPEDEAILVRMEKAARQPSMEGKVRAGLLLQLASAWEKRKDYNKAFALAVEANAASKKLLHYDAKAHRQQCARIRYAFGKELYQHRKNCGVDSNLPVFVLGMPRSGTTLVEQIIAGHSKIFGAGELGVISHRIQGMNRWERHVGSGRHYPDCVDDLSPYVIEGIAKGILDELKALATEDKPEARHVVDKLPHNFENIGLIKFLFPNARIISVRRDPRDIALSNYFTDYQAKHGGMGFAYDLQWIGEQLADHNLLMHHWQQVFPGQILEINYEDVVEDTEAMARKMLDYIGVDWEPQVLNFNQLDRPVKTASVWQVRQPIYKTSQAKWRRYVDHLAPLIAGTNKKIEWDVIKMLSLPESGLLTQGVELYKQDKWAEAEYQLKKLLHHLPDHAAANFMLGLIYARVGQVTEAIILMEKGLDKCPWKADWRKDLIQAYEMVGASDKAEALRQKIQFKAREIEMNESEAETDWPISFDESKSLELEGTIK
ncbi:sulfotransferase [Agarivorans sp. QJM3NY_33]|uniref:sulfotransferase n=1 Tax=Agarivorans sp. QJM3NY_33 TaxID=3421432 RepID=UPI003D7D9EC4